MLTLDGAIALYLNAAVLYYFTSLCRLVQRASVTSASTCLLFLLLNVLINRMNIEEHSTQTNRCCDVSYTIVGLKKKA